MNIENLQQVGQNLGYDGDQLKQFVKEQQELEREQRRLDREEAQKQRDHEEAQKKREYDLELRKLENKQITQVLLYVKVKSLALCLSGD